MRHTPSPDAPRRLAGRCCPDAPRPPASRAAAPVSRKANAARRPVAAPLLPVSRTPHGPASSGFVPCPVSPGSLSIWDPVNPRPRRPNPTAINRSAPSGATAGLCARIRLNPDGSYAGANGRRGHRPRDGPRPDLRVLEIEDREGRRPLDEPVELLRQAGGAVRASLRHSQPGIVRFDKKLPRLGQSFGNRIQATAFNLRLPAPCPNAPFDRLRAGSPVNLST